MEKEYVIGLKKEIDYDEFWSDMETITNKDGIPNRQVVVANRRYGSKRMTHYYLTDEEVEIVKKDPRVILVEIPSDQRDDLTIGISRVQESFFTKANDIDGNSQVDASGSAKNWGLLRSRFKSNNYGTVFTASNNEYFYTLDGTGVDVVIQDSGIQPDHPEWEDFYGVSRLQQIDWYSASGIEGTQSENFYRDFDGHGTHTSGVVAGKTFGWAKNSRIYAQKLSGLEGSGDSGTGIPISDAFDTIRLWHLKKSGSRPTVVNMSWGYTYSFGPGGLTNINYRGVNYTSGDPANYGIPNYSTNSNWSAPARVSSDDLEIEEMVDAGIIVCISAGNDNYKVDIDNGIDYDNYMTVGGQNFYYHRGSSPLYTGAIEVGSLSYLVVNESTEQKSSFSNAGPGVDLYSPGHFIVSACSQTNNKNSASYYENDSFKQAILSGTSEASPQVAGLSALILQANPQASPSTIKNSIINNTSNGLLTGSSDDYTSDSTMGGEPRILYNFLGNNPEPLKATGNLTISSDLILS